MLNIIKMDLNKMFRSKSFYILNIALIVMVLVMSIFIRVTLTRDYELGKDSSIGFGSPDSQMMTNHPDITEEEYYSIQDSLLNELDTNEILIFQYSKPLASILLIIFMGIFIASELESGFIKNIIPLKNSRRSLVVSKNIVAMVFIIIQATLALISSMLATIVISGKTNFSDFNSLIVYLALQILLMIAFSSLIILITYLFKSKTVSIGLGILLAFNLPGIALDTIDGVFNISKIGLSKLIIIGNTVLPKFDSGDYKRVILVFIAYFIVYNIISGIRVQKMEIE